MNFNKLTLNNFRCFKELTIEFDPRLTVLVATNGLGKTTVLDAIRIALWPYVSAFDVVSGTMPNSGIGIDDVRLHQSSRGNMEPQLPSVVSAEADYGGQQLVWLRKREKVSEGSKTSVKDAKPIAEIGTKLQSAIRIQSDEDTEESHIGIQLPVIAHYGTGRLWKQRKMTLHKEHKSYFFSRTYAYFGCLDSASDYKSFADWFFYNFAADFEQKTKTLEQEGFAECVNPDTPHGKFIKAISSAVDIALNEQGWKGLRYSPSHQTLVIRHPDYGELKVDQLSDGLRNIIAMVADIAYRCVRLNPQLAEQATQLTDGVISIDEIDMHLHPAWQQTVIASLQNAFPKIQFIITTHSPQVLSTVPKECIRVLGVNTEGDDVAAMPIAFSYGEPSNDVLQAIMHVDPQPPVPEKHKLDELTSLVDQGEYETEKAGKLLDELRQTLNEHHPQIAKIERSIRRQKALKG